MVDDDGRPWNSKRNQMALLACRASNVYAIWVNLSSAVEPMQCRTSGRTAEGGAELFLLGIHRLSNSGGVAAGKWEARPSSAPVLSTSIFTILLPFGPRVCLTLHNPRPHGRRGCHFPSAHNDGDHDPCGGEYLDDSDLSGLFFGTAAFPIAGLLMNIHKEEDAWSKQRGLCPARHLDHVAMGFLPAWRRRGRGGFLARSRYRPPSGNSSDGPGASQKTKEIAKRTPRIRRLITK